MTTKPSPAASGSRSAYAKRVDDLSTLFEGLEGVEGERPPASDPTGAPLDLPLDDIGEDADQPRRSFDEAALQELAASIRERGVLQAITVRAVGEGASPKYRVVYGARRLRAARLAGLSAIKAVVREPSAADAYDQMIENIQRDDLSASEIAAFVASRVAMGESQADVARRLGKDRSYVAIHAAVADMPEVLRAKLDTGAPIRGVYELFQAWKRHPEPVLAFLHQRGSFTRMEALALAKALKAGPEAERAEEHPTSNAVEGSARPEAARVSASPSGARLGAGTEAPSTAREVADNTRDGVSHTAAPKPALEPRRVLAIVVHRRRRGRLILDQLSERGSHFGFVQFDDQDEPVEVALADLRVAELVEQ